MTDIPRILLAGPFGSGDLGVDAVAESLVSGLRRRLPDARLTAVCADESTFRERLHVATVAAPEWALVSEAVRDTDLVVAGGACRDDRPDADPRHALGSPTGGLATWLSVPLLAALHGKPLALAAVGVGPLRAVPARVAAGAAVRLAAVLTVRDHSSMRTLTELGFDPACGEVTADLAYTLQPAATSRVEAVLEAARLGGRIGSLVAVVPRPGPDGGGWDEAVTGACFGLLRRTDTTILLVPFEHPADETPIRRLREQLPSDRVAVLPWGHSATETAGVLGRCELVLTAHLGGATLAAVGGTPMVGVATHPGEGPAFEEAGLPGFVLDHDERDRLDETVTRAWARRQKLRRQVTTVATRQARRAELTFDRLLAWLAAGGPLPGAGADLRALAQPAVEGMLQRGRVHLWECERLRRQGDARLASERADLASQVATRDHIIRTLQQELFAKVGERDRTIRELQSEVTAGIGACELVRQQGETRLAIERAGLAAQVATRDDIIRGLQEELFAKVGERDRIIRELQSEMVAKITERDRIIVDLQAEKARRP